MTFSATCVHCSRPVFADQPQVGAAEVRALQHHLISRCRTDEPVHDDLAKLLLHFRVVMRD
jgi:hypothetical protein